MVMTSCGLLYQIMRSGMQTPTDIAVYIQNKAAMNLIVHRPLGTPMSMQPTMMDAKDRT